MSNPYTLVFGQPPSEMIERAPQTERIVSDFTSENPSNYINFVIGTRGSGKTVFVTEVADRLARDPDWIIVNLNPQRDLLSSFASHLHSKEGIGELFKQAKINLEFFGLGVGVDTSPRITDIEEAIFQMLKVLKKKNKRVLITIDEVTNSRDIRVFASSYQIMLRERLPVFLIMTGVQKDIDKLKGAEGMTFLERSPRTVLGPLDQGLIFKNYIDTLHLEQDEAMMLATETKGYSFAFQVLGYFAHKNHNQLKKARNESEMYLYEFAYNKIWMELSRKDREVVKAVAKAKTGRVMDVRNELGYSTNQFNPYRDRLINAGILYSDESGYVEIALPFFGEYSLSKL